MWGEPALGGCLPGSVPGVGVDWPKLLQDQLAGMMMTVDACREVAEQRRAAVVATEAFDVVRRVMDA